MMTNIWIKPNISTKRAIEDAVSLSNVDATSVQVFNNTGDYFKIKKRNNVFTYNCCKTIVYKKVVCGRLISCY